MHLGKFPDSTEFQSWKVNFRTEVCSKAKDPRLVMRWIRGIEVAKSIDDLITPRSILGKTDFPDCDELDAMVASALKKLHDRHTHFRKKVSVEEQRAQNNDRCLRGRQIALYDLWPFSFNWILWWNSMSIRSVQYSFTQRRYSGFWSTLGTSNFINRWPTSWQTPLWKVCTRQKIAGFISASSSIVIVQSRSNSDWKRTCLSQTENVCKVAHWSDFEEQEIQDSEWNGRERSCFKEPWRRKTLRWEERRRTFSVESKRIMSCSKGESCSFSATPLHRVTVANFKVKVEMQAALAVRQHQDTDTVINGWKNNHPHLHQNRRPRMTCRLQRVEEKVLQRGWEFLADLERDAKIRHLIFGILPYVIITKNWIVMQIWPKLPIPTEWCWRGTQHKVEERECWRISCFTEGKSPNWISRFLSEEVYSTESWKLGIERVSGTQREILRKHLAPN